MAQFPVAVSHAAVYLAEDSLKKYTTSRMVALVVCETTPIGTRIVLNSVSMNNPSDMIGRTRRS